jgi:3-hydroxyisobutyrate dehydrogenase
MRRGFSIVSTSKDAEEVLFGKDGLCTGETTPKVVVDCSSISVEEPAAIRKRLAERGVSLPAAPVSDNADVINAHAPRAFVATETRRLLERYDLFRDLAEDPGPTCRMDA